MLKIKTKYQRLNREEKKEAREKFYKTEFGQSLKPRFTRLLVVSILLFIYAIVLLLEAIIKHGSIWGYISSLIIFIFAIVFLIGRQKVISQKVNNYLIKKK